jgi:hypothetical protein
MVWGSSLLSPSIKARWAMKRMAPSGTQSVHTAAAQLLRHAASSTRTPLIPPFYAFVGRFLPPATVSIVRPAVYFRRDQHLEPFIV